MSKIEGESFVKMRTNLGTRVVTYAESKGGFILLTQPSAATSFHA